MGDTAHSGERSVGQSLLTLIGPRTSALVGSCVAVLTAYTLGMDWLASRFLVLPLGMWIVALAVLAAQYRRQTGGADATATDAQSPAAGLRDRLRVPLAGVRRLASVRPAVPGAAVVEGVLEMVGVPAEATRNARRTIGSLGSKVAPAANTLRIGVDLAEIDARELIAYGLHEGNLGVQVEWCKARSGLVADVERDMAAAGLDVLVRRERRGDINLFVAEHPDHPAAWQDWGTPQPLGYASVFPTRIDPARVALVACDLQQARHAELASRMAIACAMLARVPGRAGVGRSAFGRVLGSRPGMAELIADDGPLATVMRRIAHGLEGFAKAGEGASYGTPGFVKAAARACGAFLTSAAPASGADSVADSVTLAARMIGDEPEASLRAAAAQFAAGRAEQARHAVLAAWGALRLSGRVCDTDPLPFIMGEVETGAPGPMALGRVAAGIALAWATAPAGTVHYLREDLLDDLSHAGWLRSRPADVELLKGVIEALEKRSEARMQAA